MDTIARIALGIMVSGILMMGIAEFYSSNDNCELKLKACQETKVEGK